MTFGRQTTADYLKCQGHADIILNATINIKSNSKEQTVTILEHGYTIVATRYAALDRVNAETSQSTPEAPKNPIQKALRWKMLMRSTGITMTQLAKDDDVSKALISQHVALLDLPASIVDFLKDDRSGTAQKKFSLRELQRYLALDPKVALEQFHQRIRGLPVQDALQLE